MATIDFPLAKLTTPEEWGNLAFIYAPSKDEFYITQEKHKALEASSLRKFEAKVLFKESEVIVTLPYDFAKQYFLERKAQTFKIEYEGKVAIAILVEPKKALNSSLA